MLVSRLRRKLDIQGRPSQAIRTIRSTGYVFMAPANGTPRGFLSEGEA
jgi:DNA-binding response OmpR family regulator